MKVYFAEIHSRNVFQCLAIEEYLLTNFDDETVLLLFWIGENAVVLGKNQNPWKEVSLIKLNHENIKLARRVSGGGTVFHDNGNLNFTFITSRKFFDINKQFSVIIDALSDFGIHSFLTGNNDLMYNSRKFSGNAFAYKRNAALHHGTLLVDTELSMMSLLNSDIDCIKCNAIGSRKQDVINLRELNRKITIGSIREAIIARYRSAYKNDAAEMDLGMILPADQLSLLEEKHRSWKWVYARTPDFTAEMRNRDKGIRFSVSRGEITDLLSIPGNDKIQYCSRMDIFYLNQLLQDNSETS